jgi:hypothetical protein
MDAEAPTTRPLRGRFARANGASTPHAADHAVRVTRRKPSVEAIERPTRRVATIHPVNPTMARPIRDPKVSYGRIGTPSVRVRARAWP